MVDEAALLEALEHDAPASAVLDVFETEPLPPDSVWWTHPKVIMSPHSSESWACIGVPLLQLRGLDFCVNQAPNLMANR